MYWHFEETVFVVQILYIKSKNTKCIKKAEEFFRLCQNLFDHY